MPEREREHRLRAEYVALSELQQASSIFRFETDRDPPDRYHVTFHGRGLMRGTSSAGRIEIIELHRCEIRLPLLFPDLSPDVRWLTPIFHPNVSFSGFIPLSDIGLEWNCQFGLDDVCERLWDVARAAFFDHDQATNGSAKKWFLEQHELSLPADSRPLRDLVASVAVVHDVLYINEDTPIPELPAASRSFAGKPDDVLYIGDE